MASPAKLQAAAALAEVANGIEGEVSPFGIIRHLIGSVNQGEKCKGVAYCFF